MQQAFQVRLDYVISHVAIAVVFASSQKQNPSKTPKYYAEACCECVAHLRDLANVAAVATCWRCCARFNPPGKHISVWFYRKFFVYYHHSTPSRNRHRKVHKIETKSSIEPRPFASQSSILTDTPRRCCRNQYNFSIYIHFDRALSFSVEPFRNMRPVIELVALCLSIELTGD